MLAILASGIALTAGLFACQSNEVDKVLTETPSSSLVELVRLGEKVNPTDAEISQFNTGYKRLSLAEFVQYRQIQHADLRKTYGNTNALDESLTTDLAWFKQLNQESINTFGKPTNQLSDQQEEALFASRDKEQATNSRARQAQTGCPAISFNTSFTRGAGGTTNLFATGAREVDPGGKQDCDCQLAFATTNSTFRRLRPLSTNAASLLSEFGGRLGGRQLSSGASRGSYPVFGKGRVQLWFPSQAWRGCAVLSSQYTLSNR